MINVGPDKYELRGLWIRWPYWRNQSYWNHIPMWCECILTSWHEVVHKKEDNWRMDVNTNSYKSFPVTLIMKFWGYNCSETPTKGFSSLIVTVVYHTHWTSFGNDSMRDHLFQSLCVAVSKCHNWALIFAGYFKTLNIKSIIKYFNYSKMASQETSKVVFSTGWDKWWFLRLGNFTSFYFMIEKKLQLRKWTETQYMYQFLLIGS